MVIRPFVLFRWSKRGYMEHVNRHEYVSDWAGGIPFLPALPGMEQLSQLHAMGLLDTSCGWAPGVSCLEPASVCISIWWWLLPQWSTPGQPDISITLPAWQAFWSERKGDKPFGRSRPSSYRLSVLPGINFPPREPINKRKAVCGMNWNWLCLLSIPRHCNASGSLRRPRKGESWPMFRNSIHKPQKSTNGAIFNAPWVNLNRPQTNPFTF